MRIRRYNPNAPLQCRLCGHVARRRQLDGERYRRLALGGIRHLAPGDCEPPEYQAVCPACGARESFRDAPTCAECGGRPCRCTVEAFTFDHPTPKGDRT